MKNDESLQSHIVISNKFYPPHIDRSQSLLRLKLLKNRLPEKENSKKVIILEAQAGQGKTTLISQFLEYNELPFLWYQIGPEDSDPVQLLSSLLHNFTTNLEGFSSPKLASILSKGSVGALDLTRCANILLHDLDGYLKEDLYLVFDDLHRIEFGALTNKLFEHLIDTSPPKVRFIISTRQPVEIKGQTIRNGSQISYLNTFDLALDNTEIEELFTTILNINVNPQEIKKVFDLTSGWIMGILLASHPMSGKPKFWLDSQKNREERSPTTGHMLDYFQDEIFAQFPENLHSHFLEFSFLHEIPADLASIISGLENYDEILSDLSRENYFIYQLDDDKKTFRLHHFFQEFLQQKARKQFDEEKIADLYSQEAEYYIKQGQTEKALTCYRHGGKYEAMETILKERGMELIAQNKTLTIFTLLQTIKEETLFEHPWLTLYNGLMRVDFIPQTTLPFWDAARETFIKQKEETGELIALSQTIYFHFVISGEYHTGSRLLERTKNLLEKNMDNLPTPIVVMAARNLASGYCFFNGEMDKARHYIQIASRLANRHDVRNFIASVRFIQGYIELLSGNRAKYLREAEICFSLFNDPLVGESNRLTMRIMNLCYLSMIGDHYNFQQQRQAMQDSIDTTVVDQTIAAPYVYVWGTANLIACGQTDQALTAAEKGAGVSDTAATPHMKSQLMQWLAFGLALKGYQDEAVNKIEQSAAQREQAGGPFFISFHNIIAGAVYTRTGNLGKAEICLEKGLSISQKIPSTYLTICALFNLSYLKLQAQGEDEAIDDLEAALSMMQLNGYTHFWSWEPVMATKLLSIAVQRDIQKSFVQSLARERLFVNFTDEGVPMPLLKFTLLDHFELSMAGKVLFRAKDLTPFQRELLGLLITGKGQRIPQERIQVELWPESAPENARKSFDTLLTRLRKLFTPQIETPVQEYLSLQKGILCLTNYQIDGLQFLEAARTGLTHSKNSDWWQAENAFQTALSLWKDAMPEDTFKSQQVLNFNDTLVSALIEVARAWAANLADSGKIDEAISILERVLKIDYQSEELTQKLYNLLLAKNSRKRAIEILARYKKALLTADYTEEEADSCVNEIKEAVREL